MENRSNELSTLKKVLFFLTLVVISLSFVFLVSEVICRVMITRFNLQQVPAPSAIDPYQANPYINYFRPFLYAHLPHAAYIQATASYRVNYRINSHGFRGPEIALRPAPGYRRLVVIGDSMVEGHGVEYAQAFPTLLSNDLKPLKWEVVNCGVLGASPVYYALNLPRYLAFHPDTVLLVLYDNDLHEDALYSHLYRSLPLLDDPERLIRGQPAWFTHSRLLTAIYKLWRRANTPFPYGPLEKLIQTNCTEIITNPEQIELEKRTGCQHLVAPSLFPVRWKITRSYLDYLLAQLQRQGIKVMVISLSSRNLLLKTHPAYKQHSQMLYDHIMGWTRDHHLAYCQASSLLRKRLSQKEISGLTLPNDPHLSLTGHQWLRREIFPWLKQQLQAIDKR